MRQGFLRSSRYSPGNMDRESLEALFVGRENVMQDVLSRVADSIKRPDKHYILLVGPRGSGKTHFLALAYHRILDQIKTAGLEDKSAVALLNEEEWGVASYLDFLVRILRALSEQTPDLAPQIAQIHEKFSRDPADAEAFASSLLAGHTRGKTLLLLCENLVDLFHGLNEEGQKRWRATIQQSGNWSIIATTPALFADLMLKDHPFYGFFTIRNLKGIDVDTGLELLMKKAVHEGKTELATFLRTPLGRARVRAIHHLAAGNHRAYVVLFDFLDKESLDDLVAPFMHMVDDLTPYYQDRMRQLPPAQRKILEFLCMESRPRRIKEIATSCLMSHQTAAKQIGELAAAKFVSRIPSGRNTYCELSEPLMRICIEVKDNKTQHFRLFVEFLRHWFSNRELERRFAALEHNSNAPVLDRVHIGEAVKCYLADRRQPFVEVLHHEAERYLDAEDYPALAAIQEALVRDGGDTADFHMWIYALVEAGDASSAIAAIEEAGGKYPDDSLHLYTTAKAYDMERRWNDALSAINRALALEPEDPSMYLCLRTDILLDLKRYEEAIADAEAIMTMEPGHWHGLLQIASALFAQGSINDARARIGELVQLTPHNPDALREASRMYASQGELDEALDLIDRALALDKDNLESHRLRSRILFDMADYQSASDAFRELISRDPSSVDAHRRLSDALYSIGNYEEAVEVAGRLISLDPTHCHAYFSRARALIELGRISEAVAQLDGLLPTEDFRTLIFAASEVRLIGDYDSAHRYLDRAAELQPDDLELWRERTQLQIDAGDFETAAESASKVEVLSPGSLSARLLIAQITAATSPLDVAFEPLATSIDLNQINADEDEYVEAISAVLSVSLSRFGPRYLHQGIVALRNQLEDILDESIIGNILGCFLFKNLNAFNGSLEEWNQCLNDLATSLADLQDSLIPIEMLDAAVRYTKTADKRHLLSLPLEQRQLLEDILPQ